VLFSSLPPYQPVDTPWPGSLGGEVQKQEAVKNGQFAVIQDWKRTRRRVLLEVRHCHLTARYERGAGREQANGDQNTAREFNHARYTHERRERHRVAFPGDSEEFLASVHREHQSGDDPKQNVKIWRVLSE
jgi:hypothetical protein